MGWAPALLTAYSTLRGSRADAAAMESQARVAQSQAYADEQTQRRQARAVLGSQAAAMAEAGGGIDENVVRQSAINAELDALNIRYAGNLRGAGLLSQARAMRSQGGLLAGAQLLSGVSGAYTRDRMLKLQGS